MKTPDLTSHEVEIGIRPDSETRESALPAGLIQADAEAFIDRMQAIDGTLRAQALPH